MVLFYIHFLGQNRNDTIILCIVRFLLFVVVGIVININVCFSIVVQIIKFSLFADCELFEREAGNGSSSQT